MFHLDQPKLGKGIQDRANESRGHMRQKGREKKEMGEEKQTTEQFPSKQAGKKLWNDVYGVGG